MVGISLSLETPEEFSFPFEPYGIQREFMRHLFECIENRKVGLFESPTGTGKSLSLICAALTWLDKDAERAETSQAEVADKEDNDEPTWVKLHAIESKRKALEKQNKEMQMRLQDIRDKELREKQELSKGNVRKKPRLNDQKVSSVSENGDKEFELDDYKSEDELGGSSNGMSETVKKMLQRYQNGDLVEDILSNDQDKADDNEPDVPKIYYCSRTHTQLAQFINEVKRTSFAANTRTISLGSRRNLCINPEVQKLTSMNSMNEECLERQKASKRCEYLPKDREPMENFKDHAYALIRDIEELALVGKKLKVCPYYGTRASIKQSQIVTLPYNLLLQRNSRQALGIDLKDKVILIDEAHNLISAITGMHTCILTLPTIQRAKAQMSKYLEKFRKRLKGKNVMYIKQILAICGAMERYLIKWKESSNNQSETMCMANAILHELGIDHFNLYKIERYLTRSQVARKVSGYIDKLESGEVQTHHGRQKSGTVSSVQEIEAFFIALTNIDADGRVFICEDDGILRYKYVLLDPSKHFSEVVEEARSVILAGGTMEPIEDFMMQLFPQLKSDRISRFSCGHIIPKENLLVMNIKSSPGGTELKFTFDKRNDTKLIDELGLMIANFASLIPDGIVIFFPSYSQLEYISKRWKLSGTWNRINSKKRIFEEPRTSMATSSADKILFEYSQEIEKNHGAILLSVVGGKMSEGINFSDHLGRGVIMIGLPFSNSKSLELQERIKYIERIKPGSSQVYYENLCMRAVNQSIGRAIRHGKDYSNILLIDSRYGSKRIREKLPNWIGDSVSDETFGNCLKSIVAFFKRHKN